MTKGSDAARAVLLALILSCGAPALSASAPEEEGARLNNEGIALLRRGDRRGAIEAFAAARRILAGNPTVDRNLAAAYLEEAGACTGRGELDGAVHWLDQAAAVRATDAALVLNLAAGYNDAAVALLRAGRCGDAAALLRTAVGLRPGSALLRANLGTALFRDNRRDEALEEFGHLIAREPANAAARKMAGRILHLQGRMPEAVTELSEAVRLDPSDAETAALLQRIGREYQVEKEFAVDRQAGFTVSFDGTRDDRVSRAVVDVLEEARREVGAALNFHPREKVAVVIYTGRQFRDLLDGARGVGGLYDGRIRVPVGGIDTERDRGRLRHVLTHEYVHWAVHFLTHNRCPTWLNEGIAEYLSLGWDGGKDPLLRSAMERGTLIPLSRLSEELKGSPGPRTALAYAQALSVVALVADRSGIYVLRRILDFLDEGDDLDTALRRAIVHDLAGLEEAWTGALRDRFGIRP